MRFLVILLAAQCSFFLAVSARMEACQEQRSPSRGCLYVGAKVSFHNAAAGCGTQGSLFVPGNHNEFQQLQAFLKPKWDAGNEPFGKDLLVGIFNHQWDNRNGFTMAPLPQHWKDFTVPPFDKPCGFVKDLDYIGIEGITCQDEYEALCRKA